MVVLVYKTIFWSPLHLLGVFRGVKENLQRYLRERKDVFKELQVLVEKGKVAFHKLTKIYRKVDTTLYVQTSFTAQF